VALGGHCPVTLLERNTWQKADPLFGAIHEGQTYLFVSTAEQQRFLANPNRYTVPPIGLDGYCPVTLRDNMKWQKADKQHFAIHRGRVYFFATAAAREQFLAAPDAYAPVLSGCDPVRFAQRGEIVNGKRSYGLITKDKQIYLFADQQSLETFEKNPAEFQDKARQAMAQVAGQSAYR
jgi:YHS domain-containing protein